MASKVTEARPEIVAWMKPSCGWSNGVRAVMERHGLDYEDRDIINEPDHFYEMVRLTGQQLQPCVRVGDVMLADVSGEELEAWLVSNGVVDAATDDGDVALDQGCEDHSEGAVIVSDLSEPSA